jgi:hypothetical protein
LFLGKCPVHHADIPAANDAGITPVQWRKSVKNAVRTLLAAAVLAGSAFATSASAVCTDTNPDGTPAVHTGNDCSGPRYRGGCGFSTLNDTTPGGQLGGQDVWNGGVYLAVRTNDSDNALATITASCELKVNGVSQGIVLGPVSGQGVVATAGTIQFTAAVTDIVSLCDHVKVGTAAEEVVCGDATTTQIIPQPVVDIIDMVIKAINDNVLSQIDPTICPIIAKAAPGVGPVIINGEGDVWLFTNDPTDKWYDCPPYDPTT